MLLQIVWISMYIDIEWHLNFATPGSSSSGRSEGDDMPHIPQGPRICDSPDPNGVRVSIYTM